MTTPRTNSQRRLFWLAKTKLSSAQVNAPPTLVMDLEGSDGRERGEDDTSFERQSALFALAVADVLLINMWAKDVGRETGAGKPLLKTIFQVLRAVRAICNAQSSAHNTMFTSC